MDAPSSQHDGLLVSDSSSQSDHKHLTQSPWVRDASHSPLTSSDDKFAAIDQIDEDPSRSPAEVCAASSRPRRRQAVASYNLADLSGTAGHGKRASKGDTISDRSLKRKARRLSPTDPIVSSDQEKVQKPLREPKEGSDQGHDKQVLAAARILIQMANEQPVPFQFQFELQPQLQVQASFPRKYPTSNTHKDSNYSTGLRRSSRRATQNTSRNNTANSTDDPDSDETIDPVEDGEPDDGDQGGRERLHRPSHRYGRPKDRPETEGQKKQVQRRGQAPRYDKTSSLDAQGHRNVYASAPRRSRRIRVLTFAAAYVEPLNDDSDRQRNDRLYDAPIQALERDASRATGWKKKPFGDIEKEAQYMKDISDWANVREAHRNGHWQRLAEGETFLQEMGQVPEIREQPVSVPELQTPMKRSTKNSTKVDTAGPKHKLSNESSENNDADKQRTLTGDLETNLGEAWEPQVDRNGNRPCKKKVTYAE